jgi:hypothetical protein
MKQIHTKNVDFTIEETIKAQSYSFTLSATSVLDDDGWSTLGMSPVIPGKETVTHRTGG